MAYKLICEDLYKQTKIVVESFEDISKALSAERELQALADKFEKPLRYGVVKA